MYRSVCVFFILAIASNLNATPESVAIPDTNAGRKLSAWLDVFSRGDQDAFVQFIQSNYSKELLEETNAVDRADGQARTYLDARSFVIRSVEQSTPQEVSVLAQAALTGLWFQLTMKVDESASHEITEYKSQRIRTPRQFASGKKLTDEELAAETNNFINRLVAADAFSGAIMLVKDGKPIFQAAHGMASKAFSIPIRLDTKLNIASVGKMFTAIAIGQLAEQGKLSFRDTVGKHLPDYPNKEVAAKVTIHHLLSHSSGLGDTYSPKYPCVKVALRQVKDWFPLFINEPEPLAFAPGEKWQYSNAGFILLGAIIEKVSGENFFDYIRTHIFKAAGMTNTDYYEADIDIPNLAMGYTNYEDLGEDNIQFKIGSRRNTSLYNGAKGGPTGGASSTLEDLLRFTNAFHQYKLLSKEYTEIMTTSKIFARKYDASDTYWGYGFELESVDGKRVIGHGGGDLGISSGIRWFPDSGNYTLIILSNYDRGGIIANYKLQEMILNQNK